jgi:hypothetical protein
MFTYLSPKSRAAKREPAICFSVFDALEIRPSEAESGAWYKSWAATPVSSETLLTVLPVGVRCNSAVDNCVTCRVRIAELSTLTFCTFRRELSSLRRPSHVGSRLELAAEILALRHQFAVLQRTTPTRPRLRPILHGPILRTSPIGFVLTA